MTKFGQPLFRIGGTTYLWPRTELHCLIGQNDQPKVCLVGHFDKSVGKWPVATYYFVLCTGTKKIKVVL